MYFFLNWLQIIIWFGKLTGIMMNYTERNATLSYVGYFFSFISYEYIWRLIFNIEESIVL